jgi:cell division inhibitor SulA/protein ImuA
MSADSELARLLEHPAIWRGRSAARTAAIPTGFDALDDCLPGRGWPRTGLMEILIPRFGVGELSVLLPALAALTRRPAARWCMWIAPPLDPFAPALVAHGITLERVLIARAPLSTGSMQTRFNGSPPQAQGSAAYHWTFEQSLGSGACDVAMAWARRPRAREIRRLQLAAERGRTLGVLFRSRSAACESSPAILRVALEPLPQGVRLTLLKSRGGKRGSIEIALTGG